MAESFSVKGQQCDVGQLRVKYNCGSDLDSCGVAWDEFCNCMFLEPVVTDIWFADDIQVGPFTTAQDPDGRLLKALLAGYVKQGKKISSRHVPDVARTADWRRCVTRGCGSPDGCHSDAAGGNDKDGFNISPFMLMPPWTDAGAGARGIPKRNAGFFYSVVGFFEFHPEDFTPLAMWHAFWENKAKFVVMQAKLGMYSFLFPPLAVLLAATNNPLTIIVGANAQVAAEGKDWVKEILKPMLNGTIKDIGTALSLISSTGQPLAVAGILTQRVSQDQVDDGSILKWDPITQSVVLFFSQQGEELGHQLQKVLGGGLNLSDAPHLLGFIEDALGTIARTKDLDKAVASALTLTASMFGTGRVILEGIKAGRSSSDIADDVCYYLFRVKFSDLKAAALKGKAALTNLLQTASSVGGIGSIDDGLHLLDSIGAAFDSVAKVVQDVAQKLGGIFEGLEKMKNQFVAAAQAFDETRAAAGLAMRNAAAPANPNLPPVTQPHAAVPAAPIVVGGVAVQVPGVPGKSKVGTFAIAGAVAGAFVGGPPGAAVGAGAGAIMGKVASTPGAPPPLTVVKSLGPAAPPPTTTTSAGTPGFVRARQGIQLGNYRGDGMRIPRGNLNRFAHFGAHFGLRVATETLSTASRRVADTALAPIVAPAPAQTRAAAISVQEPTPAVPPAVRVSAPIATEMGPAIFTSAPAATAPEVRASLPPALIAPAAPAFPLDIVPIAAPASFTPKALPSYVPPPEVNPPPRPPLPQEAPPPPPPRIVIPRQVEESLPPTVPAPAIAPLPEPPRVVARAPAIVEQPNVVREVPAPVVREIATPVVREAAPPAPVIVIPRQREEALPPPPPPVQPTLQKVAQPPTERKPMEATVIDTISTTESSQPSTKEPTFTFVAPPPTTATATAVVPVVPTKKQRQAMIEAGEPVPPVSVIAPTKPAQETIQPAGPAISTGMGPAVMVGGGNTTPDTPHVKDSCPTGYVQVGDQCVYTGSEALPPGVQAQVRGMSTPVKVALGVGGFLLLRKLLK